MKMFPIHYSSLSQPSSKLIGYSQKNQSMGPKIPVPSLINSETAALEQGEEEVSSMESHIGHSPSLSDHRGTLTV